MCIRIHYMQQYISSDNLRTLHVLRTRLHRPGLPPEYFCLFTACGAAAALRCAGFPTRLLHANLYQATSYLVTGPEVCNGLPLTLRLLPVWLFSYTSYCNECNLKIRFKSGLGRKRSWAGVYLVGRGGSMVGAIRPEGPRFEYHSSRQVETLS